MTQDPQPGPESLKRNYTKLWLALGAVLIVLALIFVPPLVSLNRYQSRITQVVSTSLGRPVHLSSAKLRMLPRPGFLITNLTVDEDPAYGTEPVLHANTVRAAIRFLPLWRGKLELSRIVVDEASLNLVHAPNGSWNLDSLLHTATAGQGASVRTVPLPYMEATSSRINIKNGVEKLPFSLLDADASLWQESSGEWRARLRGQPARTDVNLDLGDTGIVRLEARLGKGPSLQQSPLHVDVDWREAQLGQLTKLVLASDEGWRGDLTGELHLDGTAESAQVTARLRASGVHRAEFVPADALDFDASCGFVYRAGVRSLEQLHCESPIGKGRARLTGTVPAGSQPSQLTLELDRIPAELGLDVLRTLRRNMDPGLQASGTVSGKMVYDPAAAQVAPAPHPDRKNARPAPPHPVPGPLSGSFTVDALQLSGDGLSKPIQVPHMVLEPLPTEPGEPAALGTSVSLAAGGSAPLAIAARMALSGFQIGVHGTAALARLRELAHVAGIAEASALNQFAGEPATLDLSIDGSWLPTVGSGDAGSEKMVGTVSLRDASWNSDFLANPVQLKSAMLHVENGGLRWDALDFVYGPVKGTATLDLPAACEAPQTCPPHFTVHFASLRSEDLQSAILGARRPGTLVSTLLARIKPSSAPTWPQIDGDFQADMLEVGMFALKNVSASLRILATGAEAKSIQATVLGGSLTGIATLTTGDKPSYKLDCRLSQLDPAQVGQLAGMRWSGGKIDAATQLDLSGYTEKDLAATTRGSLHLDWHRGAISNGPSLSPALARFDRWSADASIADRTIALKQNEVQHGSRKIGLQATATFGTPAKVTFTAPQEDRTARR